MPDIHLEPFSFDGHTLCPEIGEGEPDTILLAALVARGAMLDPELAPELLQAHATVESYQVIFAAVVQELARIYEEDETVHAWFLDYARLYQRQHPHPRVKELIERLQAQLVPARKAPARQKTPKTQRPPHSQDLAPPAQTPTAKRRRMLAQTRPAGKP